MPEREFCFYNVNVFYLSFFGGVRVASLSEKIQMVSLTWMPLLE